MSSPPATSPFATMLAGLALLVALGHVVYAQMSSPNEDDGKARSDDPPKPGSAAPVGSLAAPECRCDDAVLRRELAGLRDEVAQLKSSPPLAVPPGERTTDALRPTVRAAPTARELEKARPGDEALPKVQVYIDMPPGVSLSQRADGSIEAVATDPAAAGQEYLVYALTEAGETIGIRIAVP